MDMISCVCSASAQALAEHFSLEAELLSELIRRGLSVGEFRSPDPRGDAQVVLGIAELYTPGGARAAEELERCAVFSLLLRGILAG